jgi:hypothetical protein
MAMARHIETNDKKTCTDLLPLKKTTYYHKDELQHKHGLYKQDQWMFVVNWLLVRKVESVG